jgi:hypothetical protein
MKRNLQFQEVQQFRQQWLWYLLISSSIISLLPLLVFMFAGEMPLIEGALALAIVLAVTLINIAAFYYIRLEIKITDEGIAYRWWPVFRKYSLINWDDIDHVTIRKYSRFQFGFHISRDYGRVHNVDGNMGFQVILRTGKKYFFGTQKKLSVETVLSQSGKLKQ